MGIFGIIVAVAGLMVPIVLFVLDQKRKRIEPSIESFDQASTQFRAAFSDSIAGLNDCEKDIHFLMSSAKIDHDKAIEEFRWYLPRKCVAEFSRVVIEYRSLRDSAEPAFLQFARAEATGRLIEDQRSFCIELLGAINKLLDFAKPIR